MNFFMGKKFMSFGGKGSQKGPQRRSEMVFGNGENDNRKTKRVLRPIKSGILMIFMAITVLDSFYTLSENEMAMFITFGRSSSVMTSGPKFEYPFIQKAYKMFREIKEMPIGCDSDHNTEYPADSENNPVSLPSESEMITKDFNFINMGFHIEYQVVDSIKAYISSDTTIPILKNLTQSCIRDTVGSYSVDKVIIIGKSEIQTKIKPLLSEHLEQEDVGIGIVNVTIQNAEPPTEAVDSIFKAMEDTRQGMGTEINKTKKYQSKQLPAANAKADKAARDAEAYRQQRISEAEGQMSRFNGAYEGYAEYPLITEERIFYKTMEELLPTLKVIINGSDRTQTMLFLDSFVSESRNGGAR